MMNLSQLKLRLLPSIIPLLNKMGMSWQSLGSRFNRETIICQIEDLFKIKFPKTEQTDKPLDLIFLAYLGWFQGNNIIQITLAKILKERGHRVRFILCDIELPICESTDISTHNQRSKIVAIQQRHLKMFFGKTDFEVIWLTELVPLKDIENLKVDLSSDKWDTYVNSMLLRYFKVGMLNLEDPLTRELFIRGRHAALISEKLGEAIVKMKPDRVAFSHGTYTTRGPAKDIMNLNEIPIFSISRGKMAESQKFNWKTSGDWWSVDGEWLKLGNRPLNDKQHQIIDDYLSSRRNHERDIIVYNKTVEEDRELTIRKLGLDPAKTTYTLFTNVLWDASSAQREIVFENSIEWVIETINWFGGNPDKQLVIRIHPAESIIGTNQPMAFLIKQSINPLPENVFIIESDAPINSWSLVKITDLGLVHTSTVGMELALEGIACVCVARTHYRGKGFTIDVNTKDEYFSILHDGIPRGFETEETRVLAKRYAYLVFIRYQIPLPFYYPKSHIGINSFKKIDWLPILDSPGIKTIIKSIEDRTDFLLTDEVVYELYN